MLLREVMCSPGQSLLYRYLEEYIRAARHRRGSEGPLFRTTRGRSGELTGNSLLQPDVWRMIRRRALAAGIQTEIGCHTFRATGSQLISRTAAALRLPNKWLRLSLHGQRDFTTGEMTRFR